MPASAAPTLFTMNIRELLPGPGRGGLSLTVVILCLGVMVSGIAAYSLADRAQAQARTEFGRKSELIANEIIQRLTMPTYGLNGARGAFAASQQVQRGEFEAYVASRDLPREFPGSRGFGYVERIARGDLDTFLSEVRADGAPGFVLRQFQEKDRDTLYIVRYIEPSALNPDSQGIDLGSSAVSREVIERAITTGDTTLSPPLPITRNGVRSQGFLLFVPVYTGATIPPTEAERKASLRGVLYAPLIASELFDEILGLTNDLVTFELYTGHGAPAPETWVAGYHVIDQGQGVVTTREPRLAPASRFSQQLHFRVHGQPFTIQTSSTPALERAVPWQPAALVLAIGLLLTALLARMASQSVHARLRAEALARSMTVDLERLAVVVPTPDGKINPAVLAAARIAGVDEIYRVGGAQAIAALAYGTETIRPVDKITGPGNAFVAEAKRQVGFVELRDSRSLVTFVARGGLRELLPGTLVAFVENFAGGRRHHGSKIGGLAVLLDAHAKVGGHNRGLSLRQLRQSTSPALQRSFR